jgi:hypothetical protein
MYSIMIDEYWPPRMWDCPQKNWIFEDILNQMPNMPDENVISEQQNRMWFVSKNMLPKKGWPPRPEWIWNNSEIEKTVVTRFHPSYLEPKHDTKYGPVVASVSVFGAGPVATIPKLVRSHDITNSRVSCKNQWHVGGFNILQTDKVKSFLLYKTSAIVDFYVDDWWIVLNIKVPLWWQVTLPCVNMGEKSPLRHPTVLQHRLIPLLPGQDEGTRRVPKVWSNMGQLQSPLQCRFMLEISTTFLENQIYAVFCRTIFGIWFTHSNLHRLQRNTRCASIWSSSAGRFFMASSLHSGGPQAWRTARRRHGFCRCRHELANFYFMYQWMSYSFITSNWLYVIFLAV